MNVVWESTLDGKYMAWVERTDAYHGVLKVALVSEPHKILQEWPVGLSYGAAFGPDVGDVAVWQDIIVDWIGG